MRSAIAAACAAGLAVLALLWCSTRGATPARSTPGGATPAGDGAASTELAERVARLEAEVARLASELGALRESRAGESRELLEPAPPSTQPAPSTAPLAELVEREVERLLAEQRRQAMDGPLQEWLTGLLVAQGFPSPRGDAELGQLLMNAFWAEIEWEGRRSEEALAGWNEARCAWQEYAERSYGKELRQQLETDWARFRPLLRLAAGGLWRASGKTSGQ